MSIVMTSTKFFSVNFAPNRYEKYLSEFVMTVFCSLSFTRLVEDDERKWTDENISMVALKHFPNVDSNAALKRPILYSNWLSKDYIPVDQEELRDFVKARLKV